MLKGQDSKLTYSPVFKKKTRFLNQLPLPHLKYLSPGCNAVCCRFKPKPCLEGKIKSTQGIARFLVSFFTNVLTVSTRRRRGMERLVAFPLLGGGDSKTNLEVSPSWVKDLATAGQLLFFGFTLYRYSCSWHTSGSSFRWEILPVCDVSSHLSWVLQVQNAALLLLCPLSLVT